MTPDHIELSIKRAKEGQSNLSQDQLAVRGFSTATMRRIFSNLCNLENGTYLEVGLFCGGTFVSSFNPGMTCIGIENFAQDFSVSTVKEELEKNIDQFVDRAKEVYIHNTDCYSIDKKLLPDHIDIFFYDGEHSEENQAKALPFFFDKLADTFIFIIDDLNWPQVWAGTHKGFDELKDKIDIKGAWILRGYNLQDDPVFHNGLGIYLINKVK